MKKNIFLFCLCITIAALGYKTSIATKEQTNASRSMRATLTKEQNKSDVLEANWTYLNRSERLEILANDHLQLTTVRPEQIVRFSDYEISMNLSSMGLSYKVASVTPTKKPLKG
jgi:hypothetical protein